MTVSKSHADLNIQEKVKTTISGHAFVGSSTEARASEVFEMLIAPGWPGTVVRVLVTRLRYPDRPYTGNELEVLLALTLALQHAGLWKERRDRRS